MRKTMTALLATAALLTAPAVAHADAEPPAKATFELPAPTGPHRLGMREVHLVDQKRNRELMVSVWYPARPGDEPLAPYMTPNAAGYFDQGAPAMGLKPGQVDWAGVRTHARKDAAPKGRWPVVLYSPGWGSLRTLGTSTVEDLASRGYVVVTVDHTHEAPFVEFPGGRLETAKRPQGDDYLRPGMETRLADVRFVLDRLPSLKGLAQAMDLSRVGMFGHSFGGDTAAEVMRADGRVDAGADLDGWLAYDVDGRRPTPSGAEGTDRPFLLMGSPGSTADGRIRNHLTAPAWKSFWERSSGWKRDLSMPEAMHYSYTDLQTFLPQLDERLDVVQEVRAKRIGTVDPDRSVAAQRAYLSAFFDQSLKRRPQRLLLGESPAHPDVDFVR
ncbi:alpha/beta hydrolase family protein [Nonomuraea sp. bgisy101]|uniref:alpha/beta hydrolase family protein n=1 Tax=Nonomuraea sp. bgisy101 TaxID=3413784 RepID=UPI003D75CBD1